MLVKTVIKRDGREQPYDLEKVVAAVSMAGDEAGEKMEEKEIRGLAERVSERCGELGRAVSSGEIEEFVEDELDRLGRHRLARNYMARRYERALAEAAGHLDKKIASIVDCTNEDVKQENSNKNPTVVSVQRDYLAGELSRDFTMRRLLPLDVAKAHEDGIIHFHDADYFVQRMHNCSLVNLEDMLQNGTVISGVKIERPHSFSTACNIALQIVAQVASVQFGLTI